MKKGKEDVRLHGPICRKKLEYMMPEYGSECTCGLEALIEIIQDATSSSGDVVGDEVAAYLNEKIYWRHKDEGRDPFTCWCGKNE